MRYGVIITGGEPRDQVELARAAEAAGWDGVFTWDGIHVSDEIETFDPFALMAAFAMATERVTLGAIIQPLSRRKPWEVARQATTVDRLSGGRLVLPVGLGARDDRGFGAVGEASVRREQAERLDESLEILAGLWSGDPYGHTGKHYAFPPMAFRPTPVRRHVPVWVVGAWPRPRSMKRVVRHDGILPSVSGGDVTPEIVAEIRAWLGERRSLDGFEIVVEGSAWLGERRSLDGFEIVVEGSTSADDAGPAAEAVRPWREAGATWWLESDWSNWESKPALRRIQAGPPRG